MKLLIATKNNNKVIEIKEKFLSFSGLEILSISDFEEIPDVIEDGATFEENALKKARVYADSFNVTALSDDSGLEIDALNGEPGIYSSRYGGEEAGDNEKMDLVLSKLKDIPDEKRNARFVCVIAIVQPDGNESTVWGVCPGRIAHSKIGSKGFGYDPIFFIPEIGKTMAELTLEEKNRLSHRAIALEKSRYILNKILQ